MKNYEKPVVVVNDETAEGVYAASGAVGGAGVETADGAPKCDSIYMQGVWQNADYTSAAKTYKQRYGCMGCPAFRANGCGLQLDYVQSGYASSYDVDNGKRKPTWEVEKHKPDEATPW